MENEITNNNSDNNKSIWQSILNRRMLICILIGFSSGLPLYILYQLIPFWLRKEGVDLATIGLFSLVAFPYTWKFIWSPIIDRYTLPFLGRRKGWILCLQVALLACIACFGAVDPVNSIASVAVVAFAVAFFSASQDIVLDGYRREILPDEELGLGNSLFVNGYRAAVFVPGALALILSDHMAWSQIHMIVASFMLVGIVTTLFMPEPEQVSAPPKSIKQAVIEPFKEFFGRKGVKPGLEILAFMLLYKLGDSMATALITPFYLDTGFTGTEIGAIAKLAGFWSLIIGGIIGGVVMIRLGINRSLWIFGVVQIVTILGFVVLDKVGADKTPVMAFAFLGWDEVTLGHVTLAAVVSAENFGAGLGTVALVAFIAASTSRRFSVTQLALFTSLTAIPRTFINASTGFIIEATGYVNFFYLCTLLAIPGMLMLIRVAPWNEKIETQLPQK